MRVGRTGMDPKSGRELRGDGLYGVTMLNQNWNVSSKEISS